MILKRFIVGIYMLSFIGIVSVHASNYNEYIPSFSNNNPIPENTHSNWIKYDKDDINPIWHTFRPYFMEHEMYNKLSFKEPDLLDIMVYCYQYSINYDSRIKGLLIGKDGKMSLDVNASITPFGYPFKFGYYTDEMVSQGVEITYQSALQKYTEELELMMSIDANDIKETEKCYGGFRERNGKIEFVISRVNNNKLINEYVYIASRNDLIEEFFAGNYTYKDANTQKESTLNLSNEGVVSNNSFYSDFKFVTYTTPSNEQKPGILLLKCGNLPNDECFFSDINIATLVTLEYNHKNATLSVYEVNNKESCYEVNTFNETEYNINRNSSYRVNCGKTSKGNLLFTLKRNK